MKQKTSIDKFKAEITKILVRVKPVQEKIEKVLADSSIFQKWAKRSAPWREKIIASFTTQLDKAKTAADITKKKIRDLNTQYKTEPKKAFTNTVTKASSIAKSSWKKRRHNKQSATSTKPSTNHGSKTEKRDSATS